MVIVELRKTGCCDKVGKLYKCRIRGTSGTEWYQMLRIAKLVLRIRDRMN